MRLAIRAMLFLYSFIYLLILTLLMPFEFFKRPKSLRRRWLKEKFGFIRLKKEEDYIWIHAVSVGEVNAVVPLIKAIRKHFPQYKVVLSTITDTGQNVAQRHFKDLEIVYLPFDLPILVKRAMSSISMLIIAETEIWPNLLNTVSSLSIPILLVNGRLSEKSFRGYKMIRPFIKDAINNFTCLCVQNDVYAHRLSALTDKKLNIVVTGNLKFDISLSSTPPKWKDRLINKVLIAGSTHKPEEEIIIKAFLDVLKVHPHTTLILAPRHPERFKEVEDILKTKGLSYEKTSCLDKTQGQIMSNFILLDVMGELASTYSICDIAIMGGSFIKHGGQNPLEPAYWSKAIVCGPHMENFKFIDEFYRIGAAVRCEKSDLSDTLNELLSDNKKRDEIGKKARQLLDSNSGAVNKVIETMSSIMQKEDTTH